MTFIVLVFQWHPPEKKWSHRPYLFRLPEIWNVQERLLLAFWLPKEEICGLLRPLLWAGCSMDPSRVLEQGIKELASFPNQNVSPKCTYQPEYAKLERVPPVPSPNEKPS